MKTATFIKLANDIQEFAPTNDLIGYVDNVIIPNANQAAKYYEVPVIEIISNASKIALDITVYGYVTLP